MDSRWTCARTCLPDVHRRSALSAASFPLLAFNAERLPLRRGSAERRQRSGVVPARCGSRPAPNNAGAERASNVSISSPPDTIHRRGDGRPGVRGLLGASRRVGLLVVVAGGPANITTAQDALW